MVDDAATAKKPPVPAYLRKAIQPPAFNVGPVPLLWPFGILNTHSTRNDKKFSDANSAAWANIVRELFVIASSLFTHRIRSVGSELNTPPLHKIGLQGPIIDFNKCELSNLHDVYCTNLGHIAYGSKPSLEPNVQGLPVQNLPPIDITHIVRTRSILWLSVGPNIEYTLRGWALAMGHAIMEISDMG